MPCGHNIGRDSMTAMVRSLIDMNKYEIRCPFSDINDIPCNTIWEYSQCKKIGVFTAEEKNEF